VAQVPADRDRDHLRRERNPASADPLDTWTGGSKSTHTPSLLRTAPVEMHARFSETNREEERKT
jgi:hypothetical protein